MRRKLRFAMIGGGKGSFIGAIHRIAAQMDGQAELVAGALSSDPARAAASGADLCLDPSRIYGSYHAMATAEAQMPRNRRLDFVVIATPNDRHFAPAALFLRHGFNVVCDKPVALDLEEAVKLGKLVERSGKVFVLTHNYTGNAMVKQARVLIREGRLGPLRKVVIEYSQGWLATRLETTGQRQAEWRTDPARAGIGGCVGDIGTHAENLARYVTGLEIESLCADLTSFVEGRVLDDDASILLRFKGGAKGLLHCSQICVGEENSLSIRVYGAKAALEWRQTTPDELVVTNADTPRITFLRGTGRNDAAARRAARLPAGHPEGYLEAFANVYREAFRAIRAEVMGRRIPQNVDFPSIADGVTGMRFIAAAVRSSRMGARWVSL